MHDESIPFDPIAYYRFLGPAMKVYWWFALVAASSRGKVIFLMDQYKAGAAYLEGHPGLRNRVIFTNARPGEPDAAFVEVNDPLGNLKEIPDLVKRGT